MSASRGILCLRRAFSSISKPIQTSPVSRLPDAQVTPSQGMTKTELAESIVIVSTYAGLAYKIITTKR